MSPVLLALALAPVAAVILYVYYRDTHEKESVQTLLFAFFLGIVSVIPAIIGSLMGGQFFHISENPIMTAIYAFVVVALSEELAKYVFLRYVLFPKRYFNEPYDGIIYGVMIGMGFAALENILYVADGGMGVAMLRMFTAVPAHAAFGVVMGYWVGLAKFDRANQQTFLVRGLLAAILLHGAYDFFLMQSNIPALVLVSFIGLVFTVRWSIKAMRTHGDQSPFNPAGQSEDEAI